MSAKKIYSHGLHGLSRINFCGICKVCENQKLNRNSKVQVCDARDDEENY